jgi:hypothetical protein
METIAAMTKMRREDIPRSLLRLEKLGLLRRSRKSVGNGWSNNHYEVIFDEQVSADLRTGEGVRNAADRVSADLRKRCPQIGTGGVRKIAALTEKGTDHRTDSSKEAGDAPAFDPKKKVFERGKSILGKSSGGMVTKVLRHAGGDCDRAVRILELAASKSDPREYIGGVLRGNGRADEVLAETERLYRDLGIS